MKIATGIDLIEISRLQATVERHGQRFLERIFTAAELAECGGRMDSLAARFAVKEAVAKALGTGIGLVGWREIEIYRDEARRPLLRLHGAAAQRAAELGLSAWSISMSHTEHTAVAVATAVSE